MLNSQLHKFSSPPVSYTTLIPWHKPFISGNTAGASFPRHQKARSSKKNKPGSNIKAVVKPAATAELVPPAAAMVLVPPAAATLTSTEVVAKVIVQVTVTGFLESLRNDVLTNLSDLFGKSIQLELVAADLNPDTGYERDNIKASAYRPEKIDGYTEIEYECKFWVPDSFGEIGAVIVENEHHHTEMFLKRIELDGIPESGKKITINCESWVRSKYDNSYKRIFFTNKSFLPSQTPEGLVTYRKDDLLVKRGNGTGQREAGDRIYDYDVYNDLGDPHKDEDLARPVLGGKDRPYPRRCRTGRPHTKEDPLTESREGVVFFYVPRDETFSEVKGTSFALKGLYSVLHGLIPLLEEKFGKEEPAFPYFTAIDKLFDEGADLGEEFKDRLLDLVPSLTKCTTVEGIVKSILLFETPELINRDKFSWMKDEEFGRQTLAGLNPCSIRLVKEWPLKSELDPVKYGPPESAITKEVVEQQIFMTVEEAISQKKLFILDYHDLLLPYVHKVRDLKGTTLYGSRTLFFLTPINILKPIAIELVRPQGRGKPQWKQVYRPGSDSTTDWLWKLAKTQVLAHDSGYHQLVSHWLRTHCATEPYIIATNRQLSAMHPIYRLLHPYFRYTMEINSLARKALINAGGSIETAFSPGKYSLEFSSVAYDKLWRFDLEGLPADLISRGMAEEDPEAPYGLKLAIEDYPYANDGLILWDCIKTWVTDYVSHYYPEASLVESDQELNAWWTEIRTVGHGDKKDEPWWPDLKTPQDLIGILATIIWAASGLHAAVNFGQYDYAGYFPNRPTITRTSMPTEDPSEESWKSFLSKPEDEILSCFPTQYQATLVMSIMDMLSNHSPEEEYIGAEPEPAWADEPVIKAAFQVFSTSMKQFTETIDERNADRKLRNRTGAGVMPYNLLKPNSEPGVTGQGVPNSISI